MPCGTPLPGGAQISQEAGRREGQPRQSPPCGKGVAERSEQLGVGEFDSLQDGAGCRGFLWLSAAWCWVPLGQGSIGGCASVRSRRWLEEWALEG